MQLPKVKRKTWTITPTGTGDNFDNASGYLDLEELRCPRGAISCIESESDIGTLVGQVKLVVSLDGITWVDYDDSYTLTDGFTYTMTTFTHAPFVKPVIGVGTYEAGHTFIITLYYREG